MALGVRTFTRLLSSGKTVESKLLNVLGVSLMRTVAARSVYHLRPVSTDAAWREHAAELRREGVVVIHDFLPTDAFARLRDEAEVAFALAEDAPGVKAWDQGPTRYKIVRVHEQRHQLPEAMRTLAHPGIAALVEAGEHRRIDACSGHRVLEQVTQGAQTQGDPETDLHTDTFFHTHKAWLYLTDVGEAEAPLVVVPRSHRLGLGRLYYDYAEAVGPNRGSRRITRQEIERRELVERVLAVPANTLVVANVHGYHRRSRGRPGAMRRALHLSFRFNPFWPTPRRRPATSP